MNDHALRLLEFGEALDSVARLASSALGAEAVRALLPSTDADWIDSELDAVAEAVALLAGDEEWSPPAIPDVRASARKLRVEGSVLDGPEVRAIRVLLGSARAVRRALQPRGVVYPALSEIAAAMLDLSREEEEIDRVVDESGEVRDGASPELYRTRRDIRGMRGRIVERLNAFAAALPPQHQVPDGSVTLREGRYVIPVRREGRGEAGGIVHDESSTGATLFVEPPVAVELMNRLRQLEAAESREVLRLLRELTTRLRPHQPGVIASLEGLVRLDSLHARARYALRLECSRPEMLPAGTEAYVVVRGFHPLLLARGEPVVPFDLRMDAGERTLLISGPNTGGKTVLLKAIGLLSLLAQSGIFPPLARGSRLPVFRDVFADIGDEQSIEASLSTFSAHLRNLGEVLEDADHESLVLTDEIGSGTDPLEGAALAGSILLELTGRSSFTVATTHLGQLKLLATENGGVVNASLQFDAERLQPTYQLVKGIPGRSYGLAIARRLGLPSTVLTRAEEAMPAGERDVARLLLELEAREQRALERTGALERELRETRALREALDERERQLAQRETDAERRARQQARDLLLQSRQEVEAAIREVRSVADEAQIEEAARAARRRVEEAAQRQRERAPAESKRRGERTRPGAPGLEPGVRVRIESLGRTGSVVEVRDGKVMVEAGSLRMLLPREDLSVLPRGDQAPERSRAAIVSGGYASSGAEARPEADLRGLRVDELELRLGRALDDAIMAGLPSFRIIHGKGTGALRDRVQEILQEDGRISAFRPGDHFEGGTGVTVVEFA